MPIQIPNDLPAAGVVLGGVGGGVDQLQMDLQGRIAQKSAELGFRDDFGGHQVQ